MTPHVNRCKWTLIRCINLLSKLLEEKHFFLKTLRIYREMVGGLWGLYFCICWLLCFLSFGSICCYRFWFFGEGRFGHMSRWWFDALIFKKLFEHHLTLEKPRFWRPSPALCQIFKSCGAAYEFEPLYLLISLLLIFIKISGSCSFWAENSFKTVIDIACSIVSLPLIVVFGLKVSLQYIYVYIYICICIYIYIHMYD